MPTIFGWEKTQVFLRDTVTEAMTAAEKKLKAGRNSAEGSGDRSEV